MVLSVFLPVSTFVFISKDALVSPTPFFCKQTDATIINRWKWGYPEGDRRVVNVLRDLNSLVANGGTQLKLLCRERAMACAPFSSVRICPKQVKDRLRVLRTDIYSGPQDCVVGRCFCTDGVKGGTVGPLQEQSDHHGRFPRDSATAHCPVSHPQQVQDS